MTLAGTERGQLTELEILTIGDELVEGRLVDSHSAWLSGLLFEAGLPVRRHVSVGDDEARLVAALKEAAGKSAAVVVCGGLGPTTDDLTAACAAQAFGYPVVLFPEALEHTRAMFLRIQRPMTPNNEKQAWLPEGATLIPNPRGTACGFWMDVGACRLYFLPGVPHEMKHMFQATVLPDLLTRLQPAPVRVAGFKTFGLGESKVGALLEDLKVEPPGELFIQYRAAFPEIHVRLCLRGYAAEDPEGERLLEALSEETARRLGRSIFSRGADSLPMVVVELLRQRGGSLAVAESCTGGLLGATLTQVPGVSEVFWGGVISYSNAVKEGVLGVPRETLERVGAVSQEVAEAMAQGARTRLGAQYALAVTGVAGPDGGTEDKPVGTVWLALATPERVESKKVFYAGDRERVRTLSTWSALELLRRELEGN